jgi:DNA-binding NtrC family response regulator
MGIDGLMERALSGSSRVGDASGAEDPEVAGANSQHGSTGPIIAPNGFRFPQFGPSSAIRKLLGTVLQVAPTEAPLLLLGETGSGKGYFAQLIHESSRRSGKRFLGVVCGVLTETLFESEVFGHERGAFTGATEAKPGRFELAGDGTLFLDEIGDLTPLMQVKLLRVLEDGKFERVGGTRTLLNRARVVAATNRNLKSLVKKGTFREDLYYRLNVVALDVPPLRERALDIPGLVDTFLGEFGTQHHGRASRITPEAMQALSGHCWPGNVRDLRNCLETLVVLDRRGTIEVGDLPAEILTPASRRTGARSPVPLEAERASILGALSECRGNRLRAAKRLSMSRGHFYRLLKKHGL